MALPSYLAVGLPVIASVRPESETARIVLESRAGYISRRLALTDSLFRTGLDEAAELARAQLESISEEERVSPEGPAPHAVSGPGQLGCATPEFS